MNRLKGFRFMTNYLVVLAAGTLRSRRSRRILSSRSKMSTSWVLVVSITYFRALAVARTKVWR